MENKLKLIIFVVVLITIPIFFIGCNSKLNYVSSVKSDASFQSLSETTKRRTFSMSYDNFVGSETRTINVDKGSKITIKYNSKVKEGTLTMQFNDPYGNLLTNLPVNKKGSFNIVAKGTGKITIIVTGKNTSGSFEILWKPSLF